MEVLRRLNERGLVYQATNEEKLAELLSGGSLSFYVGFDPTASSLHLGHLVPLMAASHLQKAGHRPVLVVGGGTALIGDPTGRSLERVLESRERVEEWAGMLEQQLKGFLDFDDPQTGALVLNNLEWLCDLNYIDFLREIGRHFSVNRMLSAESVKLRLEEGLSFLEFNYMLLQAYDYLHLYRTQDCLLQLGGADQWGNIVAGIDLIRRIESTEVYGLTCPLVTASDGQKMSKTMPGGAVWLDPDMTSPYDYYQFWINVDDDDAAYFLKLYTFIPREDIEEYSRMEGKELRKAKERLAWEATAIAHGREHADRAREAAKALFAGRGESEHIPTLTIALSDLDDGLTPLDLFVRSGLCASRGEVRRLARQGGLYINEQRVENPIEQVDRSMMDDSGTLMLRAGKKRYHRVLFE